MSALKRKRRPCIVIKICRLPAIDVMATGTIRNVPAAVKLPSMRIVMTTRTLLRRGAIVHVLQCRFQCRRSVAIYACYPAMRTE